MIRPQRMGRFLPVDESGHVQPDVAGDRINGRWKPLVDFVSRALIDRHGVRSVYIRGSIPRGLAIENVSDADFIYCADVDFAAADADLEAAAMTKFPFVRGLKCFRLGQAELNRIHPPQRRPYFHMLLKTQSLFLTGDDVVKNIEPFKIGPDMVSHVFSLANEFAKATRWLANASISPEGAKNDDLLRPARQWISKRIVRSGLEVTMDRCDHFTRDLYLCYEQFSKFYPQWSWQMYQILVNCLNGADDPARYAGLIKLLVDESARLQPR